MNEKGPDDGSESLIELQTFEASWGAVIHFVYADTTIRFFSGTVLVSLDYGKTCFMCGPGCATRMFFVEAGGHYQMRVIDGDKVIYHESKGSLDEEAEALGRARGMWFLGGGRWPG